MKKLLFNVLLLMSAFTIQSKNVNDTYTKENQTIGSQPIRLSQATTQENDGQMVNHFYKQEPISATKKEFNKAMAEYQKAQKDFRLERMLSMTTVNNNPVYSIDNKVVAEKEYKKAQEAYNKTQALVFSGPTVIQDGSLYYKYQPKEEITEQEFNKISNLMKKRDLQEEKDAVTIRLNKTDAELAAHCREELKRQLEIINKSLEELNKEMENKPAFEKKAK